MNRPLLHLLALWPLLWLGAINSPVAAQQSQPQPAPEVKIDWAALDDKQRSQLVQWVQSPHWPIRAFGLLRLERYCGRELSELVASGIADDAWQVRCFALRQA